MPIAIVLILVFASVGILDTAYLSYHAYSKKPVACWFFPKEWCAKVQNSPQSKLILGIPNGYMGFLMYAAILASCAAFLKGLLPFWPVTAVITVGFLFSAYFTYVQAFVLKAFCTWCVVSAINFTVMFIAAYFLR